MLAILQAMGDLDFLTEQEAREKFEAEDFNFKFEDVEQEVSACRTYQTANCRASPAARVYPCSSLVVEVG
jgi:broad specificity phosphatase PhoE